jgi:PAS domain S-box-containing protein
MFGQAAIGIGVVDLNGRFTTVNQRMADIAGRSVEQMRGLASEALVHPDDWACCLKPVRRIVAGEINEFAAEGRYVRPDGTPVWVHVSIAALHGDDGKAEGFIAIVEDITVRRRADEALRLADRQKDEFLALLSHELRNPLAPIRTAVELLRMRGGHDEGSERLHGVIDRQVKHLVRLVDDLLDVSRVLRDKVELKLEVVAIGSVLAAAEETVRPLVDQRRQRLTIAVPDMPLYVTGDDVRLSQVFGNLLNNASKYTERSGSIHVTAVREGDDVVVNVRDTGAGIPADVMPRIFEPFVQADRSLQRAQGGLGIGLTLVKKLVEMHGGTVAVASDGAGCGSDFSVRMPAIELLPAAVVSDEPPVDLAAAGPMRILVVDDNVDAAESLEMLLTSAGHDVAISRDGIDAVRRGRAWRPNLVLLDIGLPGMSGYEVAAALRRDAGEIPLLIALTGYGRDADRERALASGFDDHLVKPVDAAVLSAALQRCRSARARTV